MNVNVSLAGTAGNESGWIVITWGWGIGLYCGFMTADVSGAYPNPAVTLGLAAAGNFHGGWCRLSHCSDDRRLSGGGVLLATVQGLLNATETRRQNWVFSVRAPAIPNTPINLLCEIIATFVLVLGVYIAAPDVGLGALDALPVALVFGIGLGMGGTTGYAINPARDLGPRLAHAILPIEGKGPNNWSYAWVPVLGPLTGGVLAATLYRLLPF